MPQTTLSDQLFQNSPEAIVLCDSRTRLLQAANPAFVSLLGYGAQELTALALDDFIVPALEAPDALLARIKECGAVILGDQCWRRKDGMLLYVHASATAIQYDGRALVGFLAHDITAHKRSEEGSRRRAEMLAAMSEALTVLRQARSREDMPPLLLKQCLTITRADAGALILHDTGTLTLAASYNLADDWKVQWSPQADDPLWRCLESGEIVVAHEDEPGEFHRHPVGALLVAGFTTSIFLPMKTEAQDVGVLHLAYRRPTAMVDDDRWLLLALAAMAGNALQRIGLMDTLEQQVRDRTREVEALFDIAALTSAALDERLVIERAVGRTLAALRTQRAAVYLLGPTGALALAHQSVPELDPGGQRLAQQVVEANRPLVGAGSGPQKRRAAQEATREALAFIGVPLRASNRVLGAISVWREAVQPFGSEEVLLLGALGDHIGTALESVRLRQRAEQAAVIEERQRLARDLHDAVTQSLYSLTLFTEVAAELVRAGEQARALDSLAEVADTARQALKEMRLLIYELRPPVLERDGLIGALRHRLQAVEGRANVQTRLQTDGELHLARTLEAELYYVAQEALNNALKHSGMSEVTVELRANGQCVELDVTDNGIGFDVDRPPNTIGMGLANMCERVSRIGGRLNITSAPGEGTRVSVAVPVAAVADAAGGTEP